MAKIYDDILEQFLEQLRHTEGFSADRVQKIRELFIGGKKPKAVDLVKVLSDNNHKEHLQ